MRTVLFILLSISLFACKDNSTKVEQLTSDDNFEIVKNNDLLSESGFSKKVIVFDIPIYAVSGVSNKRLLHAANVMAQYLDNNADGDVDNQLVHDKMKENKSFMVMWKRESDLEFDFPENEEFGEGQDLGNDETIPDYVSNNMIGRFDASLEEVLHIITHAGYGFAYPEVFGEEAGSELTNAMDIARGGHFTQVPNQYPANAWFTYYDETCDYESMATEYLYWGITSLLGAQINRLDEIGEEWSLNTTDKFINGDSALHKIISNPIYKIPTVLPNGKYRPSK
jgi:hypothetical protein